MINLIVRSCPGMAVPHHTSEVRVPKTAELVARRLRRQIVRGELLEGDALPSETALMEVFGVSRPTLREAFRVLESESLISVRRGSHGATLADVYDARRIVEPPCAGRLAASRTSADVERLRVAIEHAEALEDAAAQVHAQTSFHQLVVELAGNVTMGVLHGMLQGIIDAATDTRVARVARPAEAKAAQHGGAKAHRRLLELVEAGDVEGAEALWHHHVQETTTFLLSAQAHMTVLDLLE
jgi:DNA-binding FadR family transcriptional regulator